MHETNLKLAEYVIPFGVLGRLLTLLLHVCLAFSLTIRRIATALLKFTARLHLFEPSKLLHIG